MTDYEALLRSVIDRPDDDTPRLVLADWCDDQSDPGLAARAAFIRAQVELARVACGCNPDGTLKSGFVLEGVHVRAGGDCARCKRRGLWRRAAEAFAAMPIGQKILTGGEGADGWSCEFFSLNAWSRGFPAAIRACGSTFWRNHHADILAAAPIRRVELADVPEVTFDRNRPYEFTHMAPGGGFEIRTEWAAAWGDRRDVLIASTVIPREMLSYPEPQRLKREQHAAKVAFGRTPLGYLRARWPKVEFVLPPA